MKQENKIRICQSCGAEVKQSEMSYTRDPDGLQYRLVCSKCYDELMKSGHDKVFDREGGVGE